VQVLAPQSSHFRELFVLQGEETFDTLAWHSRPCFLWRFLTIRGGTAPVSLVSRPSIIDRGNGLSMAFRRKEELVF